MISEPLSKSLLMKIGPELVCFDKFVDDDEDIHTHIYEQMVMVMLGLDGFPAHRIGTFRALVRICPCIRLEQLPKMCNIDQILPGP